MGGDPVADKSGFLCMYMSNHPDTLVSYVRYWGKVSAQVSSAKMTAIDTKGMTLTYQTKGSTETKEVRVEFEPPLLGYEEVKPRLMGMKAEAEEELGMTRAPQITSFRYSPKFMTTIVAMTFLTYCTLAQSLASSEYAPFFVPGNTILSYLPSWSLQFSWGMVAFCHGFESLYVLYLCKKHRTGFFVGAQYVLAALMLGFPVISDMRKQVQDARIDSIMKGK
ncbi:hypothetical protein L226DRAFT_554795 [Lentinus tigrinus ALCF2SS1-7]|uniref:DUF2470 domain-containing protein n=1 Tax=Lentinus tigrinus ALCF2SS1-6 TaxID=1328759 RepID=A0A5C2RQL3_9APHY|nr:hypothetical protein L227DRAFT_580953 [Lentinus tigrinus ALCF2SS1-6]RPD70592.1 hypothetical protein L226DRAFT_554795 [Lentinus tigrinus ALCF2SS1-7]